MNDLVDWREWLSVYTSEPSHPFVSRALAALIASEKIAAVWISGSRATRETDEHSDTDIRIHAPGWTAADLTEWLRQVDPCDPALVRLSKLGPAVLNYECLFAGTVPIDLLVFTADAPAVAFDSVIFKAGSPLVRQPALQVVKEAPVNIDDVRSLIAGALIDQQKFAKLFARGDRLAAFFLLEAQRFAVLRLAYVAARGVDCGAKPLHTLASLKLVRRAIATEGGPALQEALKNLERETTLEAGAALMQVTIHTVSRELERRFPGVSQRPR